MRGYEKVPSIMSLRKKHAEAKERLIKAEVRHREQFARELQQVRDEIKKAEMKIQAEREQSKKQKAKRLKLAIIIAGISIGLALSASSLLW